MDETGFPSRRLQQADQKQIAAAWREIQPSPDQKRIMLVVPGRLFRSCIGRVLQGPDRIIVADCESLDEVEAALGAQPDPDLVVVGVAASENAGAAFASIRTLQARMPRTRWIVLGRSVDLLYLRDAIESDIDGMLLEDSPGEVLELLADLVILGHSFVPIELAKALAGGLPTGAARAPLPAGTIPPRPNGQPVETGFRDTATPDMRRWQVSLSEREKQILHCLIAGLTNKLIARELRIAEATVKVHVKALLRKMQVTNRTQAAISALHFLRPTDSAGQPTREPDDVPLTDEPEWSAPPTAQTTTPMPFARPETRPCAGGPPMHDASRPVSVN